MKKTLFFFAAIATIVASCAKQEIEETVSPEPTAKPSNQITIIASVDQTKTTMDGSGNFSWQASEQIGVAEDGETDVYPFVLANAAAGTFTGTKDGDLKYAVSPKSFLSNVAADGVSYTITLPETYTGYVSGTTNDIMIAGAPEQVGDDYKFTFKHAASLIKFTYANVPVGTSGFKFTADVNITGSFNLTSTSDVTLSTPATGEKTVTIMLASAVTTLNQTLEFYVPVPTGTIGSFRAVLLTGTGSNVVEIAGTAKKKTADIELNRCDVFVTPTITLSNTMDLLTFGFTGIDTSGSSYESWSNKIGTGTSDVKYAGQSFPNTSNYIQIRATSPSGIVTTASTRPARKISVTWNSTTPDDGRYITIYGKNTAYESGADLYNGEKKGTEIGTIVYKTSTSLTVPIGDTYKYIGILASKPVYLDEIDIVWGDAPHGVSASPSPLVLNGVSGSNGDITVTCSYDWETEKTEGSDKFNVSIDGKTITVTTLQNGGVSEAKIGTLRIKESADGSYYTDVEIRQSEAPAHSVSIEGDPSQIDLSGYSGTGTTITVNSNYPWTSSSTGSGFTYSPSSGSAGSTEVTITPSSDGGASSTQIGTITFGDGTASVSKDIYQNAKPVGLSLPYSYNDNATNLTSTYVTKNNVGDYKTPNAKIKFDGEGDYLIFRIASAASSFSINTCQNGAANGSVLTLYGSADGSSYTSMATYTISQGNSTHATKTTKSINSSYRYLKLEMTTRKSNVGVGKIEIK